MKKIFVFLMVSICAKATIGQVEKFAKTITEKDLKNHLYYIAGPECEGRGTGTPGIAKAAAYIENSFKKNELLPGANGGFQLEYMMVQDSIVSGEMVINGKAFAINENFGANNRANQTNHINATDIVYVGFGIKEGAIDDYKNIDAKGKIVVVAEGEPMLNDSIYTLTNTKRRSDWSASSYTKKAKAAQEAGAVALFVYAKKYTKVARWPMGKSRLTPEHSLEKSNINRYVVSEEIIKELFKESTLNIGEKATADVSVSLKKELFRVPCTNVVGMIEGTDKKEEFLIITAHMDHLGMHDGTIYYGADDDGSGTCAVMEMAEAFAAAKKKGKGPRRTVVFMTVSGEEMGLLGSAYYSEFPVVPLDKTTCNLNIDMIGRVGSDYIKDAPDSLNYVYVIGDDKLSTDLRPINEAANVALGLKLDYRYNDPNDKNRFYYRSDHYNFAKKGVPIIFYFDGVHADYHRPTDTPDKINYDLYAKRAKLVFATAWEMANREDMLKRDIPLQ